MILGCNVTFVTVVWVWLVDVTVALQTGLRSWLAVACSPLQPGAGQLVEGGVEAGGSTGGAGVVVDDDRCHGRYRLLRPLHTFHTLALITLHALLTLHLLVTHWPALRFALPDDSPVFVDLRVDQHLLEENLVELLLEVVWRRLVQAVAVLEEVQGLRQVLAYGRGVGLVAVELSLDAQQLSAQSLLFIFEQIQGDGSAVVSLEELAALVLDLGATDGQGTDVVLTRGLDPLQLFKQIPLDYLPVLV